jgi:hypothetical protein
LYCETSNSAVAISPPGIYFSLLGAILGVKVLLAGADEGA